MDIDFRRILLLPLFLLLLSSNLFAAGTPAGKISNMSGSVSYRDMDNVPYKTAEKGAVLEKGYWIKTGDDGWAVVELSDKSKLTLANNTELEITEFTVGKKTKQGIFSINQGKLKASIAKLPGDIVDYKVKSPTAIAGVRGTEFMMMAQGQANILFGNEGSAEVSGDATSSKPLTSDTMVQNTRGFTPVDPVQIKPDTPLYTAKKNFENITAAKPPKDWEASGNLPHIIARWNINYGHYLADLGKYEDALYVFQIALDLTNSPEIRSDARLERGSVYSRFYRNPEAALSEYLLVLEEYPQVAQRENALYLAGMTLYELGFKKQSKERFLQYMKEYPSGKHKGNVETIMNMLEK